jgi:hypothetical protein
MRLRLILLLWIGALTAAGCAKKPPPPPPPPEPPAQHLTAWPEGHTSPLKITDSLTLEIPLQYERSAIDHTEIAPRALISQQSDRSEARFDFFLPDYHGYTLENYRNDNDESKVEIAYLHAGDPHEAEPDAPGEYPPNMLKRALAGALNPSAYRDMYGLRCYETRSASRRLTCYGHRGGGEDLMLTTLLPPYQPGSFPQLQARYFSKRHGGVRIAWRTHVRNLPQWKDIDAQIWKFIDEWNIAPGAAAPQKQGGKSRGGAPGGA